MKLTFHGAAKTVTGSKHMVTLRNGTSFLLDCGMFQGMGRETAGMNRSFGFDPKDISFVLLSHAHIDHSGLLPRLVKQGFSGKIYSTEATYELCKIMLKDSAEIQLADTAYLNRRLKREGKGLAEPLYSLEDVKLALSQFEIVEYDKEVKVNDFVRATFINNGHILGSAAISTRITDGSISKNLFFSGDVGRYNSLLLKNPYTFPQADVIICESTYGNRLHEPIDSAAQELLDHILDTCNNKGGKVLIPAFSLGRTQEVVYMLNELDIHGLLPNIKIYVDSPLAFSATEITRKYVKELNKDVQDLMLSRPDPFGFDDLTYIQSAEESMRLNTLKEPCVIIASSGMAEAGRIVHHIKYHAGDMNNSIVLVGYAEPKTLAGELRTGTDMIRIHGEDIEVKADVYVIDSLSAHADYGELIQFLSCQDPEQVEKLFLVHGEEEAQEFFKEVIHDQGFKPVFIPNKGNEFYI